MVVAVLLPYQVPEGKSAPAAIQDITKRLVAMGAVYTGTFLVDCETYNSAPQHGSAKAVHVLHNSEYPASTFSILDTGTGKHIPLVADNLFDLLMMKMTSVYTAKKQTKIESKGARYEYSDFLIKLGQVTINENLKGVLIEINYRPSVVFAYCWEMIRELAQGVLGVPIPKEYPAYFTTPPTLQHMLPKHNDIYEPLDTINQYLEYFTNYRKQSMLAQSQGSAGLGGSQGAVGMPMNPAGMRVGS